MDDLAPLFEAIPPQYLLYVVLGLKVVLMVNGAASWIAPVIKNMLGTPSPDDGKAKRVAFGVAKVADIVAVNTRKVADKALVDRLSKQLAEKDARMAKQLDAIDSYEQTLQRQAELIRSSIRAGAK
jgi:hypothetical protein